MPTAAPIPALTPGESPDEDETSSFAFVTAVGLIEVVAEVEVAAAVDVSDCETVLELVAGTTVTDN
jgi:hypothetical protein